MTNRNTKGQFSKTEEVSKVSGRPSGTRMNSVPSGATGLKQTNGYVQRL